MIAKNLDAARILLRRKIREPASLPDHAVILPLSLLSDKENPLTGSRWAVLRALREHGPYERVQDLADHLGRGKFRVSKDVDVLAALGLAHKRRHGREVAVEADHRQILVA